MADEGVDEGEYGRHADEGFLYASELRGCTAPALCCDAPPVTIRSRHAVPLSTISTRCTDSRTHDTTPPHAHWHQDGVERGGGSRRRGNVFKLHGG